VFLSEVVRRAARLAPLMQFDLRALSPQSPEHLEGGEVELLIAPEFNTVAGHPAEKLFEDTFTCLVCADHPVKGNTITTDQYFELAHVGVEWGGGRRVTLDAQMISTGRQVRRQDVISPTFTLVPELLLGTSRIATLPTRLALQMSQRFPLRILQCPIKLPTFTEKVQWHKYQERDPAISWLRALFRETARLLPTVDSALADGTAHGKPSRRRSAAK
jgi:LysR family nod box-dependent transcriptional activator